MSQADKNFEEKLKQLEFDAQRIEVEKQLALQKAIQSGDVNEIVKAQNYYSEIIKKKQEGEGKSILVDPMNSYSHNGYVEKNFSLSYDILTKMSRTPIPRAIIGTRKEQVAEFATPQRDKYSPGFIIRKKKSNYYGKDENDEPTSEEIKELNKLTDFILNCGNPHNKWHADDFETFLRKIVGDSLTLDQYTFEVVRNRKGEINEFVTTDASTFRIADTYDDDNISDSNSAIQAEKINGYYPSYVQTYQARVIAEFYPWELCFGVRNPQSNLLSSAYGRSELEDLIETVTNLLNVDQYQGNYFKIGSNPKGLIRVKNMNPSRLEEFRSEWMASMAGVRNSHKMAVIDADKMDFISTQQSNKDMEYGKYYEFLVKISCAIFTISPEEIGFPLEGMNASKLGDSSNKTELEYSRSKGLFPLLRNIEKNINKYILSPATQDKYEFVFVGLNERTADAELEMAIKEVQYFKTVNEIRAMRGEEEIEGGDIILNPVFLQNKQAAAMGGTESNMFIDDMEESVDKGEDPMINSLQSFIDKELS